MRAARSSRILAFRVSLQKMPPPRPPGAAVQLSLLPYAGALSDRLLGRKPPLLACARERRRSRGPQYGVTLVICVVILECRGRIPSRVLTAPNWMTADAAACSSRTSVRCSSSSKGQSVRTSFDSFDPI